MWRARPVSAAAWSRLTGSGCATTYKYRSRRAGSANAPSRCSLPTSFSIMNLPRVYRIPHLTKEMSESNVQLIVR